MKTFDLNTPQDSRTAPIHKDDNRRVMRLELKAGEEVPPHAGPGPLALVVYRGQIVFRDDDNGQEETLSAGQGIVLENREQHSVKALTDATCLANVVIVG